MTFSNLTTFLLRSRNAPGERFIDWYHTRLAHVVKIDLPGVEKQDVKLELRQDGELVISGTRDFHDPNPLEWHHAGLQSYGPFRHELRLPGSKLEGGMSVELQDGVLTVKLPKKDVGDEQLLLDRNTSKELQILLEKRIKAAAITAAAVELPVMADLLDERVELGNFDKYDWYETDGEHVVIADVQGIPSDSLHHELLPGGKLVLKGRRDCAPDPEAIEFIRVPDKICVLSHFGCNLLSRQAFGTFTLQLQLANSSTIIDSKLLNGVLTITVPKSSQ